MTLYQPINSYNYNSDTLFLYNFISNFRPKGNVLDVGCGCGILGLLLARDFDIRLTLLEKQELFCFFANKNRDINGLKAEIVNIDFLHFEAKNSFDFIVSNPPFYSSKTLQSENPSLNIARYNQHLKIELFFKQVKKTLTHNGDFLFCYDTNSLDLVIQKLLENNLIPKHLQFVHPRNNKNCSIFLCHAKKNGKQSLKIMEPIFMYENLEYSHITKEIFKKANTYSIKAKIDI